LSIPLNSFVISVFSILFSFKDHHSQMIVLLAIIFLRVFLSIPTLPSLSYHKFSGILSFDISRESWPSEIFEINIYSFEW
jgi:hypothetical protein